MNVYEIAQNLAEEIKKSEEYKNFKTIKENVKSNQNMKDKIDEFEKLKSQFQMYTLQKMPINKEKMMEMQKMYAEIVKNPIIKEYFDVEIKFNEMLSKVNRTIGEAVKDVLK